jgi:hypothetical protein
MPSNNDDAKRKMREMRKYRRDQGFREVCVWLPEEDIQDFKQLAKDRVDSSPAKFYRTEEPK